MDVKGFTDNGIVPPLTYVKDRPTVVSCFELWALKDGKFACLKATSSTARRPRSEVPLSARRFRGRSLFLWVD